MKHKVKLKRKDLKKPDQFISFTQKTIDFFSQNYQKIVLTSGIILFPVLVLGGIIIVKQKKEKNSLQEFYSLFSLEKEGEDIIAKERLEGLIKKYPRTRGASYGLVYLAQKYFQEKKFEKALEFYKKAANNISPDDAVFYALSWEGIGYSLEALKKYKEAVLIYEKIIKESGVMFKNDIYISLARCYEELQDNSSALENYSQVIALFPDHPKKKWLEEKIERLSLTNKQL